MTPDLNNFAEPNIQTKTLVTQPSADEAIWQKLRREVKAISLDLWGTLLDDKHSPTDTVAYSEQRQNFLREELQRAGHDFSAEQMRAAYKHAWQYFDALWEKQIAFGSKDGLQKMLRFLNADQFT